MRYHALDGLRGVAATLVVVYHLGLAGYAGGLTLRADTAFWGRLLGGFGSSGVELFFTLSGIVLLRPFLLNGRPMQARAYFWRRCLRLWPPYFAAWMLAGATVALLTARPTWWPSAMPEFSLIDWLMQLAIVYFGAAGYNFAWWSLTVEVIFYALVPLIVLGLAGRPKMAYACICIASAGIAQVAFVWADDSGISGIVRKFLIYSSCFAGGVYLAAFGLNLATAKKIAFIGLAMVLGGAHWPTMNPHVGYGLVYLALASQAIGEATPLGRTLSQPKLVWLGERSYSLFLTHYSIIALACWSSAHVFSEKGLGFFALSRGLALVGSMLCACLVFELVERHFARGLVTVGQWWPSSGSRGSSYGYADQAQPPR